MHPLDGTAPFFNVDVDSHWTYAMRVDAAENDQESPPHRHSMGQLVLALHGGVTCSVPQGLWMVPPQCGVWIPGGVPHSTRVTANGRVCFLFVPPDAPGLARTVLHAGHYRCQVELIAHLADLSAEEAASAASRKLAEVLVDQLARMRTERLHLPISDHPRLREIADALRADPADRSTVAQ